MVQTRSLNSPPLSKSHGIEVGFLLVRLLLLGVVTLVLLIGVAWAFGALWFDFPFPVLRRPLAIAFGLAAIGAVAFVRPRWLARSQLPARSCPWPPGSLRSLRPTRVTGSRSGRDALRRN